MIERTQWERDMQKQTEVSEDEIAMRRVLTKALCRAAYPAGCTLEERKEIWSSGRIQFTQKARKLMAELAKDGVILKKEHGI